MRNDDNRRSMEGAVVNDRKRQSQGSASMFMKNSQDRYDIDSIYEGMFFEMLHTP